MGKSRDRQQHPRSVEVVCSTASNDAQLAAGAYLHRYSGRTLEAYRQDLKRLFRWAEKAGLGTLSAARPQIELSGRAKDWAELHGAYGHARCLGPLGGRYNAGLLLGLKHLD